MKSPRKHIGLHADLFQPGGEAPPARCTIDTAFFVKCGDSSKPAQTPSSIAASANKTRAITNHNEPTRSDSLGQSLPARRVNSTFRCNHLFTVRRRRALVRLPLRHSENCTSCRGQSEPHVQNHIPSVFAMCSLACCLFSCLWYSQGRDAYGVA